MVGYDEFNPGTIRAEVLTWQHEHRSRCIWTEPAYDPHIRVARCDSQTHFGDARDPRILELLRIAGFYGVAHLTKMKIDQSLIAALIERWRPDVHAFHLPFGEVGITLQDVEVVFGLKVDGNPVTGFDKENPEVWHGMCLRLLGFKPERDWITDSKIKSTFVPAVLKLNPQRTDVEVLVATRHFTTGTSDFVIENDLYLGDRVLFRHTRFLTSETFFFDVFGDMKPERRNQYEEYITSRSFERGKI